MASLRIIGYEFLRGEELLKTLTLNKHRRYIFDDHIEGYLHTTQGRIYFHTWPGFECDMRSGPKLIDWYVPNLGTFEERFAWYLHDVLGYSQSLTFKETNLMLFAILHDLAHYRYTKAKVIQVAVSISSSWYGTPNENDWCYKNIGKVLTRRNAYGR